MVFLCAFFSHQPDAPVLYPILADPDRKITVALNMLDPDEKDDKGRPLASRALHIIGPDNRVWQVTQMFFFFFFLVFFLGVQ
jgi:alkyl hydroperoxide reductase subunit AhpC